MFYQLPPAGNPVCLSAAPGVSLPPFFSSSQALFYASGTAALAAAVMAALVYAEKPATEAEIILPAYGCPDLVSAVIYAGAKPVLVDLQADRPWLDLTKLAETINTNTVAIIGVNLFGVAERWSQLRALATQEKLVLIEDSAQYFPGINEPASKQGEGLQGDLVVFSFGRGKPVSLLGGGAVYARKAELYDLLPEALPEAKYAAADLKQQMAFALKATLYNAMISPRLYWLPLSLPFLHLGETRYHALQEIEGMDSVRKKLLTANISRYQNDKKATQCSDKISKMLDSMADVINLPKVCEMQATEMQDREMPGSEIPGKRRLLRYPILVDAALRDTLYQKLKQAGLGASIMYPASLPEIKGLEPFFDNQHFTQARVFASKLITLPVYARLSTKDINKMSDLLESV